MAMGPYWVNMVYLLYGSLYPLISIKGSILEINHLLLGDPYSIEMVVLMVGYSAIAVWIREVWSG
jgi:hypothetical protein